MRRCPICKNRVEDPAENRAFPFCSERCKLIDLGNWLGEGYRIPDDEGAVHEELGDGERTPGYGRQR